MPLLKGCELVDQVRANLSGIAKRFRFAMSHVRGKIEILGRLDGGRILFKQHQAKHRKDANRIFSLRVSDGDLWLDEELSHGIQ